MRNMNENGLMIAVDAGGTKTEAVLFATDGTVLRHSFTAGINPLVSGLGDARSRCLALLRSLFEAADGPVDSVYLGIPALQYFEEGMEDYLKRHLPCPRITAEADGFMLISAMLGSGSDGAAMVCGTGSGLYIRSGEQKFEIGGWGYIIDGCGSGFVLGRRAVRAAVRERDGRGEKTLITPLVEAQLGGDVTCCIPALYEGGRPFFASFARTVFAARREGDAVARQIFDSCADDLAEMAAAGARQCSLKKLVLNGGIFQHFPEYVQALRERIPPKIALILSDVPPVFGAAAEAMALAGHPLPPGFRDRFRSQIAKDS